MPPKRSDNDGLGVRQNRPTSERGIGERLENPLRLA